mmetsp:Transcript_54656/g.62013  ORF Transcript_54656/g.62013 Transcript_54656/m.62013 type:complete len:735 (-) Transcript_54656:116-2320(-)
MPLQIDPTDSGIVAGRRSPFFVEQGRRHDEEDEDIANGNEEESTAVAVAVNGPLLLNDGSNPQDGTGAVVDMIDNDTNTDEKKKKKKVFPTNPSSSPPPPQQQQQLQSRPRPGERERFEAGRGMRSSQSHVIQERRKSFIAEFSEMKGPPQIAILMALLAIGLGSTMGIVPAIMSDRFARLNHGYAGEEACDSFELGDTNKPHECFLGSSDAQAAASVSNLISNSLTFVTASVMGSISDEYGRKGPLLIGLVLAMTPAIGLFLIEYIPTMNPWWYYSCHAGTGFISWMAIALSTMNDVLPPEFRAPGIGLLFAGFLFGISFAPTLGILIKNRSHLCLLSFGVTLVGFLLTVFFVPETVKPHMAQEQKQRRLQREKVVEEKDLKIRSQLQQQQQHQHEDRQQDDDHYFYSLWFSLRRFYYGSSWLSTNIKLVWRNFIVRPIQEMSILNRNTFFRILSSLAFFTGMVTSADQVLLLYYLEDQLAFNQHDVSLMFLIIGISGMIVQVFVMKPLNDRVGEKLVIAISFCCGSTVNFFYGVATHKTTIFAGLMLSCFTNMSFPTISAIKANNVEDCEQGRIQGALYSVKALASGVGPAFLQFIYSKTKERDSAALFGFGPGTMWYCASFLYLIAVGLALTLPNDKANTSSRHGGTHGHGGGTPNETTDTCTGSGGGMVINDDDLEEYRQLVSESDSEEKDNGSSTSERSSTSLSLSSSSTKEEERSLSSGGSADYGTIL